MRNDASCQGFTLVEVLIALLLMAVGVLGTAPLFILAVQGNAIGGDFGQMGAIAVERLEQLRAESYYSANLPPGGSLTSNVTGYFDDSNPDFLVRWTINDNIVRADTKTIAVRAIVLGTVTPGGQRKQITLGTLRGRT